MAPWSDAHLIVHLRRALHPLPDRIPAVPAGMMPAVVLVPLEWVAQRAQWDLILIQRSERLPLHRGQMAFPGGMIEPHDRTLVDAVLREVEEEIGLSRERIEPAGILPPTATVTRFWVWPIVARVVPPWRPRLNPEEVQALVRVPLYHFLQAHHHEWRSVEFRGHVHRVHNFAYGKYAIWGATARMIVHLLHVVASIYGLDISWLEDPENHAS